MPSTYLNEGVFGQIIDLVQSAVKVGNNISDKKSNYRTNFNKRQSDKFRRSTSIARASKDLVMSFPTICSDVISYQTAAMINKAVERKNVSMVQMVAAANHLQGFSGKDVIDQLHTNMGVTYNVDDYVDAVLALGDTFGESAVRTINGELYSAIAEDCRDSFLASMNKRYPVSNFSENSINDFKIKDAYTTNPVIITEGKRKGPRLPKQYEIDVDSYADTKRNKKNESDYNWNRLNWEKSKTRAEYKYKKMRDEVEDKKYGYDYAYRKARDKKNDEKDKERLEYEKQRDKDRDARDKDRFEYEKQRDQERFDYEKDRDLARDEKDRERFEYEKERDKVKDARDAQFDANARIDSKHSLLTHQLLDSDVKKVNELVPSLIVLRYQIADPNKDASGVNTYIQDEFVAGVKSRLIAVPSQEILDRIIYMGKSGVDMKNMIRATTGETSFSKDFLAGIQQAKIDAKKDSKLSKTNPIWRSLQARSNRSKLNRLTRSSNGAAAITTLVITNEEVNLAADESGIDLSNPVIASKFMEAYNLMALVIVDEQNEFAKFIYDGDVYFEDLAFSSLERDNDRSYKQMINLINQTRR